VDRPESLSKGLSGHPAGADLKGRDSGPQGIVIIFKISCQRGCAQVVGQLNHGCRRESGQNEGKRT
jgi:hypothetical protein